MKRIGPAASLQREMTRPLSLRRVAAVALFTALAACASTPQPRAHPPTSLAEINRALSWRFADVTLASEVVMRSLRGVEVTSELLRWTNESGQRREMPIAEVVRIVLRGRDPSAAPPSEGAKMLAEATPPPEEGTSAHVVEAGFGALDGATGAVVGVALGALALAADQADDDPGVLIYEAPVTRYQPAAPAEEVTAGVPATIEDSTLPPSS